MTATAAATPTAASAFDRRYCVPNPFLPSDHHENPNLLQVKPDVASTSQIPQGDVDATKAKIVSHPQYSSLVSAYIECQKVGAPPELAARLSAVAQEFEMRQRASLICRDTVADPELDQFMVLTFFLAYRRTFAGLFLSSMSRMFFWLGEL
ncbi:hypothetical protein BHM03_00019881 [Ensete ventricosum]|nr:hypothetical protein BHM03_00019881 [Ensete ventricosum]